MTDKEQVVPDGQAPEAPEEPTTPEVAPETDSPTPEVDKELTEWATNKGYSAEKLADPDFMKLTKQAYNAEKMIGKSTPQADEPTDEDLDKYLDEILGVNHTSQDEQKLVQTVGDIDVSQLPPNEQALLAKLTADITKNVETKMEAKFAPQISALKKQEYKGQIEALRKEYGDDVIKRAPEILRKVATGTSLEDATIAVLSKDLLKKSMSKGIEQGKQIKTQEVSQKVEQQKKADSGSIPEYEKLSLAEQREVLLRLQNNK